MIETELSECDGCEVEFDLDEGGESNDGGTWCGACERALRREAALAAGIPLSVVEGKTALRDHFPQSYIDAQCGREPSGDEQ